MKQPPGPHVEAVGIPGSVEVIQKAADSAAFAVLPRRRVLEVGLEIYVSLD
jgi:hypothetical protein